MHTPYQFVMELFQDGDAGRRLAQIPINVDWEPALECARFAALRRAPSSPVGSPRIEPTWHASLGEPYLSGVRVVMDGDDDTGSSIPSAYFGGIAQKVAAALLKKGTLREGDVYGYLVCAFPRDTQAKRDTLPFTVEEVEPPVSLDEASLDRFLDGAVPYGAHDEYDMPVLVPQHVLQEAVQLTQAAGAAETGGILIGHLHRDSRRPEIFAEVTAQVPARHTRQELTQLEFTAETWTDVDAALALRRRGEIYLGWWHSHPARQWCKDCPVENRKKCKLSGEFFSTHDIALHRTVFPRAYSIALVISDSYATGLTWPLFGWRDGLVRARGFHILGGVPLTPNPSPPSTGERGADTANGEIEHGSTQRVCTS